MRLAAQDRDATLLLRALSGPWSDRFVGEALVPHLSRPVGLENPNISALRERLSDPFHCLQVVYHHYAFARRGADRGELAAMAVEALHRTCSPETVRDFLGELDGSRLWEAFCQVCEERRRKPLEQLNLGVVAGLAGLAQEIYRADGVGSISKWLVESVIASGRIEPQFMRLTDIRGVGPKLASLFIRDIVFLHHLEEEVDLGDRLYVQPIDKWMRLIAPYVVQELDDPDAPDWVLAGKIAKHTRKAGVSGIRFNMGASYFGTREVRVPEALEARIGGILEHPVRR